jgi:hypothetical protein
MRARIGIIFAYRRGTIAIVRSSSKEVPECAKLSGNPPKNAFTILIIGP